MVKRRRLKALQSQVSTLLRKIIGGSRFDENHGGIYPIHIPEITVKPDLDFLLLELPPRYMPMMPNGLGYVHNILLNTGIKFQSIDTNIVLYHRYHSRRLLDGVQIDIPLSGNQKDPWDNTNSQDWHRDDIIDYFWPFIEEVIKSIAANHPRAVGLSLNGNNRRLAKRFVERLRQELPETAIIVGGYDCVYHEVGPYLFPGFDYMVIGEAELTLPTLVTSWGRAERPRNLAGIISRWDTPGRQWEHPPLPQDLDSVGAPKYEWTDLSLYQTFSGHHLIPITASRGCNWGRCRFCAECFPFRRRSPEKVVEEIGFMMARGFHTFHFNESDVNGDPDALYDICSGILRKKWKVQLVGQLRIDKRNSREYIRHLARAGFKHLRFGVDGWSDRTLQLQRKGYSMRTVVQNLHDCHEAGIYTAVNMVIGVPGETDGDVEEMIQNVLRCKPYIDAVESLNTMILAAGSEYFRNPDKYQIHFRGDKRLIWQENPYFIPSDLWYSEDPYIDQSIRLKRLDRICDVLYQKGVNIGDFAKRALTTLKTPSRAEP